ncbi:polyhydroxybutyrate depolymerase [Neptunicella sp. SCSIO 80796]|uniref:extracellular catalytic domain type 2 short-chain-length polyhydroxyalkanoate depolymerase n=1 Tax=Neptunicella plasticusilytica TaxID=3117012 RepID=UPI003A4E2E36
MKTLISCLSLLLTASAFATPLPALKLDVEQITLSGLSSGGYMAGQYHIAHAEHVSGVGIIAAGPYFCAQGSIFTALSQCVNKVEQPISLQKIEQQLNDWRTNNLIAPADALNNDRIWIFHGTLDSKVISNVSDKLVEQYQNWVGRDNVRYINDKAFSHLFPTLDKGTDCKESTAPFVGQCDYNAASMMLDYISPVEKNVSPDGKLIEFNQQQLGGEAAASLAETGYIYVPDNCQQGQQCQLHVSFHGCNQNAEAVGTDYVTLTGINQWANQHNTVILYPQTKKSTLMPLNPQACWDWWGYTDENYATRKGQQIQAVNNMVNALAGDKV